MPESPKAGQLTFKIHPAGGGSEVPVSLLTQSLIPGTGRMIEREANLFCEQDFPVHIFIKRRVNEWEYVGDYKVVNHSTAATDIAAHHKGSITPLKEVTRVIFMKRASDEDQKGKCV